MQATAHPLGRLCTSAVMVGLLATGCGGGEGPAPEVRAVAEPVAAATSVAQPSARTATLRAARSAQLAPPNADGTVRFIIEMAAPSAAHRVSAGEASQRAGILSAGTGRGDAGARRLAMQALASRYAAEVEQGQAAAVSGVLGLGGRVAHRMHMAANVLLVDASPDAADALRRLPGVSRVTQRRLLPHPSHGSRLAGTASALPPCRAVEPSPGFADTIARLRAEQTSVAEARAYHGFSGPHARGFRGQGVLVAIIDDGVDYTHGQFVAGFDPGQLAANRARLDRARAHQHSQDGVGLRQAGIFPNLPFLAGRDFWGRNPDRPASTAAEEDANPLPHTELVPTHLGGTCEAMDSHGTQVASIVRSMAPEAHLAAYRVCSSRGCAEDTIIAAIDQATRDGAHVINLSLGAEGGLIDDPLTKAVDAAALLGVIVVSAAGNSSGALIHAVASPAVAPRGVAVAELVGPEEKRRLAMPTDVSIMQTTSSIGPGFDGDQIKPEVGAIGNITSASAGSLSATEFFSGTSGATPVVSAAMAVLLSRWNGALAPHEARAILSSTASKNTVWGFHAATVESVGGWSNPPRVGVDYATVTPRVSAPVVAVGGGKLRVDRAIATPVALFAADAAPDPRRPGDTAPVLPAALNFGSHVLPGTPGERLVGTRALTVRNLTGSSITVPLSATVRNLDIKGVAGAVRVEVPASVTVPAWGDAQVPVRLFASPEKLRPSRYFRRATNLEWAFGSGGDGYVDPNSCVVAESVCAWLDRFEGYVQVQAGGMTQVGLPWAASLYRSSNTSAAIYTSALHVTNTAAYQGGKTDVFQWMGSQPYSATKDARGEPQIVEWGAREVRYSTLQEGPAGAVEVQRRAIELAYVLRGGASNLRALYNDPLRLPEAPYFSAIVGVDIDGDGRCGVAAFDTVTTPPSAITIEQQLLAAWAASSDPRDMGATAAVQDAAMRFSSTNSNADVSLDLEQWFSGDRIAKWYVGQQVGADFLVRPRISGVAPSSTSYLGSHFSYDPARPHVIMVRVPIDENTNFGLNPPGRSPGLPIVGARYFEGVRLRAGQTEVGLCPTLQSPLVPGRIALPPVRFRLGQVRHGVQGVTTARPFITTGVNATVSAALTRNASAPPSKGLLLVHEQGAVPVQTIAIP